MSGPKILPALPEHAAHFTTLAKSVAYNPGTADPNRGFLVSQKSPEQYADRIADCPDSAIALSENEEPLGILLAISGVTLALWSLQSRIQGEGPVDQMFRHNPHHFLLIDQITTTTRGIAQQLFDFVIEKARPKVAAAIIMHGPHRNLPSLRFFVEKNHFSLIYTYSEDGFEWGYYERVY